MKVNFSKYILPLFFLSLLIACSTKRDTFLARNAHALSTKYNILYNGEVGFDKGVQGIKKNSKDNFWKLLPVEKMQVEEVYSEEGKSKNPDFELAETKAIKAIQKHSMNIGGREKNYQIDEAYLLLGQARYYDQRFIPAQDAFNYILYKYPTSSNINVARIWREKTNMRLGNDALVIKNINKSLHDIKVSNQVYADANALLAEAFINLEEKDSAIVKLKVAIDFTKKNEDKARYRFILGQLYQEAQQRDSALYYYNEVVDMNRKADRKYMINAIAKKAELFDYENDDRTVFIKQYSKYISDRENRPFLDILYYEMGVFFEKTGNQKEAFEFYNLSLKRKSTDNYLIASDYRNIANMHFKNTDYILAAKYYDSTLVKLDKKTREHIHIEKIRKNLDDVIKYETIATRNDSILKLVSFSEQDRLAYFKEYIDKLKAADETKRLLEAKAQEKLNNIERNNKEEIANSITSNNGKPKPPSRIILPTSTGEQSKFYFYNPATVAYGKLQFKKLFGKRNLEGNWMLSSHKSNDIILEEVDDNIDTLLSAVKENENILVEKYTTDFYEKQVPINQTQIDSISKERNFAYYQLGLIYKEKLKEYKLATDKLENLLQSNPEQKLILPTMYNLYKIYQIIDSGKAIAMKNAISNQYPNSRYDQIINHKIVDQENNLPEKEYQKWYQLYEEGNNTIVLDTINELIKQYSGDEIVSKYELLKANVLGKAKGLEAYKKALQEVVDNYPNSEEAISAREILKDQIPRLEKLDFTTTDSRNWKIIYKVAVGDEKMPKEIELKVNEFLNDENYMKLSVSFDKYDDKEMLVVIHGIKSEAYAYDIAEILKENNKYKLVQDPIIISGSNYSIVQIKKNLDVYTTPKKP